MKATVYQVPDVGHCPYWIRKAMLDLEFEVLDRKETKEYCKKKKLPVHAAEHFVFVRLSEFLHVLREKNLSLVLFWFENSKSFQKSGVVLFEKKFCILK